MSGQLWQECKKYGCGTEPVCLDCEYCDRHCDCPTEAELAEIYDHAWRKAKINRAFDVLNGYIAEYGKRIESLPDGLDKIADTRPYFAGAGYGVGDVYYVDPHTGDIYRAHYTGSRVSEWEWVFTRLPYEGDDYEWGNSNADIVEIINKLTAGEPVSDERLKPFEIL